MQLKYSNYAAFSHVHGVAVNNSGLVMIIYKLLFYKRLYKEFILARVAGPMIPSTDSP